MSSAKVAVVINYGGKFCSAHRIILRRYCSVSTATASHSDGQNGATFEDLKSQKVDKNLLMKLRRKTGYSFINCKKAILLFGEDTDKAEAWLHKLAMQEGWAKATKLQAKTAKHGLVGVSAGGGVFGAMVEVNCETDFVSRNEKFRNLVDSVSACGLKAAENSLSPEKNEEILQKLDLNIEELKETKGNQSTVGDMLASTLSQLGEKLEISRAVAFATSDPKIQIFGYVHPRDTRIESENSSGPISGQFGTLLAICREFPGKSAFPTEKIGLQLCQHIIGMAPKSVGKMPSIEELSESDSENSVIDETPTEEKLQFSDELEEQESKEAEQAVTSLSDATELLRQDFLLGPDVTVGEFVYGHGVKILDFVRFECGELTSEE